MPQKTRALQFHRAVSSTSSPRGGRPEGNPGSLYGRPAGSKRATKDNLAESVSRVLTERFSFFPLFGSTPNSPSLVKEILPFL